jgi:pyruvate/2-oxoglutarate dehydrogenase complex dihydrolipoamide acyltransferase (E2) component
LRARLQSAALVALGVAIGGFVAVPASHLIGHEDDHIHVGGSIVYVDPDDPEAVRRARRATEGPPADRPGPDGDPSDDGEGAEGEGHGAGSLAHFGAAITASVSSPPVTPPRAREPDSVRAPESVDPAPPERSGRRARAPPAP